MLENIKQFLYRNPVRVTALVTSIVALLATEFAPELPVEPVVVFILSALGLGEYAQYVENKKTLDALYMDADSEDI
jgi:hypothetical protein